MKFIFWGSILAQLSILAACSSRPVALDRFSDDQKSQMSEAQTFDQAEFNFWASSYEPTMADLNRLRASWVEHGEAFPESKQITKIQEELSRSESQPVLVAMFMTVYDRASLNDKSQGWAVAPVPSKIIELESNDVVLRKLMPVRNDWARYFLLTYPKSKLREATQFVVSSSTGKVVLPRKSTASLE